MEPLDIHAPIKGKEFENLFVTTAEILVQIDGKSMGRCHLNSYQYTDDRNIDVVIKHINEYNQKICNYVNEFDTRVRQEISMRVPSLEEYRRRQKVNYYHYENIPYYFWQKVFDDTGNSRLAINSSPDDSLHELRKEPGNDRIAIGSTKDAVSALKEYLDSITEDTVKTLRQLREERERK